MSSKVSNRLGKRLIRRETAAAERFLLSTFEEFSKGSSVEYSQGEAIALIVNWNETWSFQQRQLWLSSMAGMDLERVGDDSLGFDSQARQRHKKSATTDLSAICIWSGDGCYLRMCGELLMAPCLKQFTNPRTYEPFG